MDFIPLRNWYGPRLQWQVARRTGKNAFAPARKMRSARPNKGLRDLVTRALRHLDKNYVAIPQLSWLAGCQPGKAALSSFMVEIACPSCGHINLFQQPYPYHAGFADQGFLYNDEGNLTLVWSVYDPAFEAFFGKGNPWALSDHRMLVFEAALKPAPSGGNWRFANPARCNSCSQPISGRMGDTIYYFIYPGSVITGLAPDNRRLKDYLKEAKL
jgi:hypothetical protein